MVRSTHLSSKTPKGAKGMRRMGETIRIVLVGKGLIGSRTSSPNGQGGSNRGNFFTGRYTGPGKEENF